MNLHVAHHRRGFSLIEMLVVMVIVGALMTLGLNIFGKSANSARRTGTDQFTAAVEQARTAAITRRKPVILAVAPPITGGPDQITRYGLFEVDSLPEDPGSIKARQVQRWNLMPDGVHFFGGKIEGLRNLLDEDPSQLSWKNGDSQATVYVLAFNSRGGLAWPTGSDPVAVKIGTGTIQNGKAIETSEGGHNSLRIGRVVARPWRLD
ncbi:pilus assembly FimT family protein [Luteolibacter soli]|uniref:Prepilin-type N-terminal cleavage/methylation domain-containing protein n=1 Tax=Luteolibacter soli TaxID=3135280 RepID=A0ABU9AU17_9BACT